MAIYPIKMLKDENGTPFVPLISLDSIQDTEGQSINELLDKKLETTNLIAGTQIELEVDGNNITINSSAEGTKLINNLNQTSAGVGALDAAQGKILKESIPEVINNLTTVDSTKALSAHQGYVLAGRSVPVGGGTGQVLMKSADDDYSLTWGDAALTPDDVQDIVAQTTEFENGELRVSTNDTTAESNIGVIHPITGQAYIYANDAHHGLYSTKWGVLIDASDDEIIFNGIADRATADGNGNDIVATYQPKIYDSGWIYPTLENGWVAYDNARPFKYRKIGEVVYIQGSIKDGTHRSIVCTLPEGFRPGTPYSNCPIRINGTTVGWFFVNYGNNELNGQVAIESSLGTDDEFVECPMFSISYIAEA